MHTFSTPRDVTIEYKKQAKSLPRNYLVSSFVGLALTVVALYTHWVVFIIAAALWVLGLILGFRGFVSSTTNIREALSKGAITRRIEMDETTISEIHESADGTRLSETKVTLTSVTELSVDRETIGVYADTPDCQAGIVLTMRDFVDSEARDRFLIELVTKGGTRLMSEDPKNAHSVWIGRL